MVKPPKTRHSKTRKDPMTIELEPGAVSRVQEGRASYESASEMASADITPGSQEEAERTAETVEAGESWETEPDTSLLDQRGPSDQAIADHADETSRSTASDAQMSHDTESRNSAATTPDTAPVAERNSSGRGLSALAAGILGGIVALAGAGGLQYAGLLPSPGAAGSTDASAMQADIAALKQRLAGGQAGNGDVEGLRLTLGESTGRLDSLSATLDQVKADVAGLKSAVESGGAGENAGLQALDTKIADLDKAVAALGQAGSGPPADGRLATIEQNLAALGQSVTALTGKVEAQASQPKVALALAVSALKAAVDAGGPFASEVETLAAVAPDSPELADLRTLAAKGVPGRAELAAEAPGAAVAMVDAGRTVDASAGVFERLLASAKTLVKIRPVGPIEGIGLPETVARIEAAVKNGDFAKALTEYETLPAASKAAGQAFMEQVKARLAAEQLVEKATAAALKAA
jgi:hypothetical protein